MLKDKFENICNDYSSIVVLDEDAIEAMRLTYDLLIAEADHIKETEPHATKTISEIENAAYKVFSLMGNIEDERFE